MGRGERAVGWGHRDGGTGMGGVGTGTRESGVCGGRRGGAELQTRGFGGWDPRSPPSPCRHLPPMGPRRAVGTTSPAPSFAYATPPPPRHRPNHAPSDHAPFVQATPLQTTPPFVQTTPPIGRSHPLQTTPLQTTPPFGPRPLQTTPPPAELPGANPAPPPQLSSLRPQGPQIPRMDATHGTLYDPPQPPQTLSGPTAPPTPPSAGPQTPPPPIPTPQTPAAPPTTPPTAPQLNPFS